MGDAEREVVGDDFMSRRTNSAMVGAGAVGDATYAAIEKHVERCPVCHEALEHLAHHCSSADSTIPRLNQLPAIPGFELRLRCWAVAGWAWCIWQTGRGSIAPWR